MSRADQLAAIESGMLSLGGLNNAVITAAKTNTGAWLTAKETGIVLVDASQWGFTVYLPPATSSMDILVRRIDNSGNRLMVKAAGDDRVKFHTHLSATGYPFFVLMGAGDFWHLRSDGNGSWVPLLRMDTTPLGRPVFETTQSFCPGGYGALNGFLFNRAEWPWLWDHAQASGMLTTEADRAGMEGGWTTGDGVSTFRGPSANGEFIRIADESGLIERPAILGTTALNSNVITSLVLRGVRPCIGMPIAGSNLPAGTTISAIDLTAKTLTLSAAANATGQIELTLSGRAAGSSQKGTLVVVDDGNDGVWNIALPGNSPGISRAQTVAGADNYNIADFAGARVVGTSTTSGFELPGPVGNWATTGTTRPRNIAYPGRIKLI